VAVDPYEALLTYAHETEWPARRAGARAVAKTSKPGGKQRRGERFAGDALDGPTVDQDRDWGRPHDFTFNSPCAAHDLPMNLCPRLGLSGDWTNALTLK